MIKLQCFHELFGQFYKMRLQLKSDSLAELKFVQFADFYLIRNLSLDRTASRNKITFFLCYSHEFKIQPRNKRGNIYPKK